MRKILKTIIFMTIILLLTYSSSYAAVIEIKNTSAQVLTNATISDFYVMAEGLKGTGQALDGATVDVKMANNYEWAVVSYFSNSAYGTGGAGGNNGLNVSGKSSTNGNITGVMDWGKTYTYTAGIISNWKNDSGTIQITNETVLSNGASIINAAGTNRVDKFRGSTANAIACTGWYGSKNAMGESTAYPYSYRGGLFWFIGGGTGGGSSWERSAGGEARSNFTFRPVIWN